MEVPQQTIEAFMTLCTKLGAAIDASLSRLDALEKKMDRLQLHQSATYNQVQVAKMTGWSVATINAWVAQHFIDVVPGSGKMVSIPAGEVDKIIARKGYGRKLRTNQQ